MSLYEQVKRATMKTLLENIDSSKEMLATNIVPSFDDMGMANTNPGEFSQAEITDKNNLSNVAAMSNDTDFEGKVSKSEINAIDSTMDMARDLMNDIVDISDNECCLGCNCPKNDEAELHILEFGESYMGKIIDKVLGGKTCEQFLLTLNEETDYAGPKDWNPDPRINVSSVIKTLKDKIGTGSEGIHVDQVYDEDKNNAYKVSQIDKNMLPKTLTVGTVDLTLKNDTYYLDNMSDSYPISK